MDDISSRLKHITNDLKEYLETRLELTILNISDKVTYIIGHSIQQLVGYTILAIGLLFALTALSIYLGELLDNEWAGYLIVGSPLILLGLIFVWLKPKTFIKRIQNQMLEDLIETMNESDDALKQLPANESTKKEEK